MVHQTLNFRLREKDVWGGALLKKQGVKKAACCHAAFHFDSNHKGFEPVRISIRRRLNDRRRSRRRLHDDRRRSRRRLHGHRRRHHQSRRRLHGEHGDERLQVLDLV